MSKILDFASNFVYSGEKMSQKKEVRKMKKFLGLVLVLGLMAGLSTLSHATANPDSLTLTVTVGGVNYSIDISSTTNDFGTVSLGAQKSLYIGTMTNDGNIVCDLDCAVAATANGGGTAWTIANTVAQDVYGLMISTSAADGAEPVWNPGDSPQLVSSVTAVQASMPYTDRFIPGATRGLWTRLSMPTSLSGASGVWTITLSLWATAD